MSCTDGSFECRLCGDWRTGCSLCGTAPLRDVRLFRTHAGLARAADAREPAAREQPVSSGGCEK